MSVSTELSLLCSAGTRAMRLQDASGQLLYHINSAFYPQQELELQDCKTGNMKWKKK